MRVVQLTLKSYLEAHGLTAYRLAQAARGRVSRGTVYALARGTVTRVDLGTLGAVMTTLEELTGEAVNAADLLSTATVLEPVEAVLANEMDAETRAWLDSDLSRLGEYEPYDWGAGGEPVGEPIRYVPGVGFVAGDA